MKVTQLAPRAGMPGFAHAQTAYPLPAGLSHGTRVMVVESTGQDVIVRDAAGTRWTLRHWQVDCGRIFEVEPGLWEPTHVPKVRARLEEILAQSTSADERATIKETLDRWG